jgi:hypothetical protein
MKTDMRVMDVDSTLEGERVGMTIDDTALAHIMSVLTDLYKDPEMAVLREYSTNAFDAHVEAGITSPIEVTLPTGLAPFLTIQDFGKGMDADDIRYIYSRYGTSMKRNSNDVVGMLGLGCKSALTYTDQFTLIAVKDGIEIQVSISRDENGGGVMTIVSETETDADSGVKVIIPAKAGNLFESKALQFFRFWDKGSVLVNGVEPKRVDGLWIADDILLTREVAHQDYIVMGNVPYPVEGYRSVGSVIYFVEIGDVSFTPSREALQMNNKTKLKIQELQNRFNNEKIPAISRLVSEAPNKREAFRIAAELYSLGLQGAEKAEYKGEPVPFSWEDKDNPVILVNRTKYYGVKGWDRTPRLWFKDFVDENAVFLTGYPMVDFTPHKRKQLDQWLQKQTGMEKVRNFVLVDKVPANLKDWINPAMIMDYTPISEEKIERAAIKRADGRPSGSYRGVVDGKNRNDILAADIDTTKPIFYLEQTYITGQNILLDKLHGEYTLVTLSSNRINKFKRDFPMAKEANSYWRTKANEWVNSLSADELKRIAYFNSTDANKIRVLQLDPTKVDDPDLHWALDNAGPLDNTLGSSYTLYSRMINIEANWDNPLEKYPLVDEIYYVHRLNEASKNHLYLYLNAAYAATQDGE